jgi:hypothetical protein
MILLNESMLDVRLPGSCRTAVTAPTQEGYNEWPEQKLSLAVRLTAPKMP